MTRTLAAYAATHPRVNRRPFDGPSLPARILAAVAEEPGSTAAELRAVLGVVPHFDRTLRRLVDQRRLVAQAHVVGRHVVHAYRIGPIVGRPYGAASLRNGNSGVTSERPGVEAVPPLARPS